MAFSDCVFVHCGVCNLGNVLGRNSAMGLASYNFGERNIFVDGIQGLSVFSFAADRYNVSKFLRRLIFAMIILNMMFMQIAAFVGLFDMIFDYRKKLFS